MLLKLFGATRSESDSCVIASEAKQSMKFGFIYILTNKTHSTLYTGVTSDLVHRMAQHFNSRGSIFTSKYKTTKLVFVQKFETVMEAIEIEKRIKGGSRLKKIKLIESVNPSWRDLSDEIASLCSQ